MWLMIINLLACAPRPQLNDNSSETNANEELWHGWLVLDHSGFRMAFLPGQDGLANGRGVTAVNDRLINNGEIHGFSVPYVSHFSYVAFDQREDYVYGVLRGSGDCALSVRAIPQVDPQGRPWVDRFNDVVGQVYLLEVDAGTKLTALGRCTP